MSVAERHRFVYLIGVLVMVLAVLGAGCGSKGGGKSAASGRSGTHAPTPAPAADSEESTTAPEVGTSAPVISVTDPSFEAEVLKSKGPVLVDFWTET